MPSCDTDRDIAFHSHTRHHPFYHDQHHPRAQQRGLFSRRSTDKSVNSQSGDRGQRQKLQSRWRDPEGVYLRVV